MLWCVMVAVLENITLFHLKSLSGHFNFCKATSKPLLKYLCTQALTYFLSPLKMTMGSFFFHFPLSATASTNTQTSSVSSITSKDNKSMLQRPSQNSLFCLHFHPFPQKLSMCTHTQIHKAHLPWCIASVWRSRMTENRRKTKHLAWSSHQLAWKSSSFPFLSCSESNRKTRCHVTQYCVVHDVCHVTHIMHKLLSITLQSVFGLYCLDSVFNWEAWEETRKLLIMAYGKIFHPFKWTTQFLRPKWLPHNN